MKRFILSAAVVTCLLSMAAPVAGAQPATKLKPSRTLLLYPEGQNSDIGLEGAKGPLVSNGITRPEEMKPNGNIGYISDSARVDLYFPKKPNGQMVVVCPGGGYSIVSSYNEGVYVAEWMLQRGITVAVVKYRLPNGHWEVPLTDVQNVFRYCRSHAEEWGVEQIGVMGFSAGGHLAASATNLYVDDVTRPDFSVLIYPVITLGIETHGGTKKQLLGPEEKWNDRSKTVAEWEEDMAEYNRLLEHYSLQNQVTSDTPVTFIAHCTDDRTVPVENSIMYYRRLVSDGVGAEMHIYPKGGHGWGFSAEKYVGKGKDRFSYARPEFERSLERWLEGIRPSQGK